MGIKFGSLRKYFTIEEAALLISGSPYGTIERLRAKVTLIELSEITDSGKRYDYSSNEVNLNQCLESFAEISHALELEIESSIRWNARGIEDVLDKSKTVIRYGGISFYDDGDFNPTGVDFSTSNFTRESLELWCHNIGIETSAFSKITSHLKQPHNDDNGLLEVRIDIEALKIELATKAELHQSNGSLGVSEALIAVTTSLENIVNKGSDLALETSNKAKATKLLEKELQNRDQIILDQEDIIEQLKEKPSHPHNKSINAIEERPIGSSLFHNNTSEHFKVAIEANNKFWKNYGQDDKYTAPLKDDVKEWLVKKGYTDSNAKILDTILRGGRRRPGGRPKAL